MFFDPPTYLDNSGAGNSLEKQQESDYIPQEKTSAENHPSFSKKQTILELMQTGGWGVKRGSSVVLVHREAFAFSHSF